jgi:hypothetical protein
MMKSEKIAKILAAASAIGAPTFRAEDLYQASRIIETKIADMGNFFAMISKDSSPKGLEDRVKLDEDLGVIWSGAEVAMAFIACPFLPNEIAAYRERSDANDVLIKALKLAKEYL